MKGHLKVWQLKPQTFKAADHCQSCLFLVLTHCWCTLHKAYYFTTWTFLKDVVFTYFLDVVFTYCLGHHTLDVSGGGTSIIMKKNYVDGINEQYVDPNINQRIVMYRIGKAYKKIWYSRFSRRHKKVFSEEHTSLQPFWRIERIVHYTLPSLSYEVLIYTWMTWSTWVWSALPKDIETTFKRREDRNMISESLYQPGIEPTRQASAFTKSCTL